MPGSTAEGQVRLGNNSKIRKSFFASCLSLKIFAEVKVIPVQINKASIRAKIF